MTLLELLANDLVEWMAAAPDGVPRRVLLWLDPEWQFARLVPLLETTLSNSKVRLLRYDPESDRGQFALKLALLRIEATNDERAIVYLPGFQNQALEPYPNGNPPDLWALYDYGFKGCVWGVEDRWRAGAVPEPMPLFTWLVRHGLSIADAKTTKTLTTGGKDSLLARYAERRRQVAPEDWPRPLRMSDVLEALGGDPRDALRRLLAAPNNEVKRWGDERNLVLERIAGEFGLKVPDVNATGEEIADAFTVELTLTEAWDAFGRPVDFPYLSRLPSKNEQRQRIARFLREDIICHTELGPRLLARMRRLETNYDLASWAANRKGRPSGLPLLARSRWQQFLKRFNEAAESSWKAARDLVIAERDAIVAAAEGPCERLETVVAGANHREIHWPALAELASLASASFAATDEAPSINSAADMVLKYTEAWWHIDHNHLKVRASCVGEPGLEQVRRVADLTYFDYVLKTNEAFAKLVESKQGWPPKGTVGVESLRHTLWKIGSGRKAVIISDACRWDFAEAVKERLGTDNSSLTPVLATLPTETEFGMTALLPLGGEPVKVEFGTPRPVLKQDNSPNLATRDGRREFLKKALSSSSGKPLIEFVEMEHLLQGAKVPNTQFVVVFDNNIDEQGHKGAEELPLLVDQFIGNLKRTVELLQAAGIGTIHLVTDHGFLLLPPDEVDAQGTPQVLPNQVYHKDSRWAALKPGAPVTEVIHFPLPLAPDAVTLGVARGIRTLVKAQSYIHGGISLQECVLPHLTFHSSLPQARLGLDVQVSTPRLAGGTVPAILRPVFPGLQVPLGIQPISVRLYVETVPSDAEVAKQATEPIEVEVRPDVEELRPAVYLKEGLDLKAGQKLILLAIDTETGKDLGKIPLTLLVDWD